ncbi:hypothetical protein [Sphingobium lignivorans]|uniref:Uncharacterized protein n=1 Tax=Sphingobium lignivorans TaxID=2735886 RepID=A0ABR6NF88_9SPHN|nr:hypothetical protein [Sphingobium lignivorans]MBB5985931.1 hypothetical protein [Sphingobium lignivorans]
MSDPFKLRVLKALTAALKTITPANGYDHDLSDGTHGDGAALERVFRGREWFGDSDPIPMLCVLEATSGEDELLAMSQTAASQYDWPILIQGFVKDDPAHPTDPAYKLLADVRLCLARESTRTLEGSRGIKDPLGLGSGANRIEKMAIGAGTVRPAGDVSAKAYFWLIVTLTVIDQAGSPYA